MEHVARIEITDINYIRTEVDEPSCKNKYKWGIIENLR